ncbi:unnamed protein product [Strongylus vulgaris]|uniref:Methyltransferase domain-containing protein n=1 Tax=Strongylus vulgaris TaxID=40348 RepID=A0A3P7IW53_STRVU|nr:unnamed protein product [Strongylus vulgaris]
MDVQSIPSKQTKKTEALLKKIRTKAMKATIAAETDTSANQYSLEDLMAMENVKHIEIFKIDIEDRYFHTSSPLNLLLQILIEVHGTPAEMITLINEISRRGYWLYSYEINGAWHNLCEFSFLHEDAFSRYGATPMAKYLDINE